MVTAKGWDSDDTSKPEHLIVARCWFCKKPTMLRLDVDTLSEHQESGYDFKCPKCNAKLSLTKYQILRILEKE